MTKNLFLLAGLFLSTITFCGCNEEETIPTFNEFTVKATMQLESRTVLGDDHSTITWSKEDKIYLFGENSNATLQLIEGAETRNGVFMGAVNGTSANLDKGFYPVPNIKGEEYSFDLPTERTYSANSAAPMFGSYSNNLIEFNNLVALVRVPLAASADERLLKLKMDGIAGKLIVDVEKGKASINEDAMNEVTVSVPAGDACYVDIPVPAKDYLGYTVMLDNKLIAENDESFTLKENDVVVILTEPNKDENGEFVIANSTDLMWVAKQVNNPDKNQFNGFEGMKLRIVNDIDLKNINFTPIGEWNKGFKGILDGQGHTISNMHIQTDMSKSVYGYFALFGCVDNGTVKNLTLDNFECVNYGGYVSAVAATSNGDCLFENITLTKGTISAYNRGTAGIVSWAGNGTNTYRNISIEEGVTIDGLWASWDCGLGGVVGDLRSGDGAIMDNITVSCRLDAFNDVTASYKWYAYRYSGMLIGMVANTKKINGTNYPDPETSNVVCTNVTVNYGDWMNYHYCEGYGQRNWARVESGYSYGGLDANHTHNDGETHSLCLPFDQLFGGDKGVYGLSEYSGVTVNYPLSYVIEVSSSSDFIDAISKGKSVKLTNDINLGTIQLKVDKAIVVDLNGKTLTCSNNYGGISLKNGASIRNGVIEHTSTVAAIKAFNAGIIEDIVIKTSCGTANKTITGIAVQQGGHVDEIKNVTIEGVSQGIEVGYQATVDLIDGVDVEMKANGTANGIGLVINGGKVVKARECTFKGDTYGITMHLKGIFAVGLELNDCKVIGSTASINAWDEKGTSNTSGSLTLTYDALTTLTGPFVWDFEEECKSVVTLNKP